MATSGMDPTIAQLVERRTVVGAEILRSLVRIRLVGNPFYNFAGCSCSGAYLGISLAHDRFLVFSMGFMIFS
jgi:hypothetical protein